MDLKAIGKFDVKLDPQSDDAIPAGRMLINKTYSGDMQGSGAGQMLSKRMDNGVSIYCAFEEFEGSVNGKKGSFTLQHSGYMASDEQSLEIDIIKGSGAGELASIIGALYITQTESGHEYELIYSL